MWRSNPLGSILVSIFFLLALVACWCAARHFFAVKEAEAITFRYQIIQSKTMAFRSLLSETAEHGKKHPDLELLLNQLRVRPPSPATSAPPARPNP